MPEENEQQQSNFKVDLSDFDIGIDDGSGELNLTRREPKQVETPKEEQTPETQQPDDKFTAFDSRLNSIIQQQQTQSNALQQMINYLLNQPQQQQDNQIEKDQLEQVFGDADKGSQFLNSITSTIEKLIDKKLGNLEPVMQKLSLQDELQSVQAQPDYLEYLPAMHEIININPGVSIPKAYEYAKQRGWKTPVQKPNTQQQAANVQNINERRLPEKTASSNANLKQGRQINSLRDALEQAMDDLTGTD